MKSHKRNGREAKIRRQQRAAERVQANDTTHKLLKNIFGKKES